MDRVEVNEEHGAYVVITEEGEFSIEKKYFEGDKPYEVLGRTAYFSLKSKEYTDLIWNIKLDEIIPKLCEDPKVNAKVYFLVLEYLGYVKIRGGSVEIKRRNLKTILYLYKGMAEYLEEEIKTSKKLAESISIEEANKKINEGITKMDELNKRLANENIRLIEQYRRTTNDFEKASLYDHIALNDMIIELNEGIMENIKRGMTPLMKLQLVKKYYEAKMTRYDVLVNQLKPLIVALESLSPDVVEKDFFDLPEEIRKETERLLNILGILMSLIGGIERTFSGELIEKAEERARKYVGEAKESAERIAEESGERISPSMHMER